MKIQEKKELLQLIETVRNLQEKIKNNISDLSNKNGAVKKSATKPVDSLDMEAHGL